MTQRQYCHSITRLSYGVQQKTVCVCPRRFARPDQNKLRTVPGRSALPVVLRQSSVHRRKKLDPALGFRPWPSPNAARSHLGRQRESCLQQASTSKNTVLIWLKVDPFGSVKTLHNEDPTTCTYADKPQQVPGVPAIEKFLPCEVHWRRLSLDESCWLRLV